MDRFDSQLTQSSPNTWPSREIRYLTHNIAPIPAGFRESPEDFLVEEELAYEPSGEGEHLFVFFEKTELTTPAAVRLLGEALNCPKDRCSWAGLKDKFAITQQWACFHQATGSDPLGSATSMENKEIPTMLQGLSGIRVLRCARHHQKLRTGHVRKNRFTITLRRVPAHRTDDLQAALRSLEAKGIPNYFGEQRFSEDSIARAKAWIVDGKKAPRDRFQRKWLMSVLQSCVFNWVLTTRIDRGTFAKPLAGDLFRKEETGGLFLSESLDEERTRMESWDISPTGPMPGSKMRSPALEAAQLEKEACDAFGLSDEKLARVGRAGAGTRRVLRIKPQNLSVELTQTKGDLLDAKLTFVLPSGSYATTLIGEILKAGKYTRPQ